jgi:hypothetical protein
MFSSDKTLNDLFNYYASREYGIVARVVYQLIIFVREREAIAIKKKPYEDLTREEQQEFLEGIREHVRIENEFLLDVQRQIYGITIEDEDEQGNKKKKKVCGGGHACVDKRGSQFFITI